MLIKINEHAYLWKKLDPLFSIFVAILRNKLFDDLPCNSHMESPDLFSRGNDLVRREDETIGTSVPELHGIAVGDAQLSQGPV